LGSKKGFSIDKEARTMKRIIFLILIVWIMLNIFGYSQTKKEDNTTDTYPAPSDVITKTYILRNISPSSVRDTLREYFLRCSYDPNGNLITVKILKENIAKFEGLLRQMDVEKRKILVRIFTIIASRDNKGNDIQVRELKQVLYELQKILSFNSYRMDGVSAITVVEEQDHSSLSLSSQSPLMLTLKDIHIISGVHGARSVNFDFSLSQKQDNQGQTTYDTLISSQTSVKENGYLVAGVSKIGKGGNSLVLIINAEIKNP
jgi:type II secretory pathway component GspD/PulD (secretin)